MEDLSLHILDIVENSLSAGATLVEIIICIDTKTDQLKISIRDNGKGMDKNMLNNVRDPFITTRTTRRVGLGISLLEQSAHEADGDIVISSELGKGTEIIATFKNSHIDRRPLGDIGSTIILLIHGNPDIDFIYETNYDGVEMKLDTREIKAELEGVSITTPAVLKLIRDLFQEMPVF